MTVRAPEETAAAGERTGPPAAPARRGLGRRWRQVVTFVAIAGPGIVAAGAGNDAGGVTTYASAGAQFTYRMLFLLLVVTVAYVVVQEMVARLAAHTGKGLGALIREEFSLRWTTFAMGAFAIANLGLVVTEFAGIGSAFGLWGVSRYICVPIAAVLIWAIVVFGSYRYAERVFLLLMLAFLTYPVAMILGHPNWSDVASNLLWPHFEATRAFVIVGVAIVGTTITPYIQLYEAGAIVDRGIGPEEYPYSRVDAIAGAIFAAVIAATIIIATGATIGGTGPLNSAADAAKALEPLAGQAAEALFGLGLLGASALAAAVVPLSTSYALAEAVGVERSVSNRFREAPLFVGLFTAQLIIGALVVLVPGNLIHLIVNTQVLEGLITPVTLAFILVLANRRSLLGSAANGPLARVLGAISVFGVGAFALLVVVLTVSHWFGLG